MKSSQYLPGKHRQQGLVAIFMTIALLFLLGIAALAIDINHAYMNKSKLQNAVDAAALAGATSLTYSDVRDQDKTEAAIKEALTQIAQSDGNGQFDSLLATSTDDTNQTVNTYLQISYTSDPEDTNKYGSFASIDADEDMYIRVAISNYPIHNYIVTLFGLQKYVSASAVAGPSTGINACNIVPVAVCVGDEEDDDDTFMGYEYEKIYALKTDSGDMSSGNFQLLALGGEGADVVKENLAGSFDACIDVSETVSTKPGGSVGPVMEGINTRFGLSKNMDSTKYPPDLYVKEPDKRATLVETKEKGVVVDTEVKYTDNWYYADYLDGLDTCPDAGDGGDCTGRVNGQANRRILAVPMVDCTGMKGGKANDLKVEGLGCFFLLQSVENLGVDQVIFGEFIESCPLINGTLNNDSSDQGPYKLVLYKDPFSEGS